MRRGATNMGVLGEHARELGERACPAGRGRRHGASLCACTAIYSAWATVHMQGGSLPCRWYAPQEVLEVPRQRAALQGPGPLRAQLGQLHRQRPAGWGRATSAGRACASRRGQLTAVWCAKQPGSSNPCLGLPVQQHGATAASTPAPACPLVAGQTGPDGFPSPRL